MTSLLKRFAVLCALSTTIFGVSLAQTVPGLSIKGDSTKKVGTQLIHEGNVVVEYLGSVLKAERAVFDTATKKIDARGNVILIPKGGSAMPPFPGLMWDVSKAPGVIQPYTAAQAAASATPVTPPPAPSAPAPVKPAPAPAVVAKPVPTPAATPVKPAPAPAVAAKPVPTPAATPVKPAPTPSVTSKPVPTPAVVPTPVKPVPTPAVTAAPAKPAPTPATPPRAMIPRELAQSNGSWFLPGMEVSGKSVSRGGNLQSATGDARVSYNGTVIDAGKIVMNKANRVIDAHNGVTLAPKVGKPMKFDRIIWNLTNLPGTIQPYSASLVATPTTPTPVTPATTSTPATPAAASIPAKPPATGSVKPAATSTAAKRELVKPATPKPAVATPVVPKPVVTKPVVTAATRTSFVDGLTWTSKTLTASGATQTATDVVFNYAGMVIKAPKAVIDTKGKVIDASGGVTLTQDGGEPMSFSAIKWDLSTPPGTIQPIITAP